MLSESDNYDPEDFTDQSLWHMAPLQNTPIDAWLKELKTENNVSHLIEKNFQELFEPLK